MSKLSTRVQRLSAVALAVVASLAVWALAEVIVGTDLRGPAQGGAGETSDINAGMVAATSLVASLAGWAVLAGLERFTARAGEIWVWIAAIVLLVSFVGPLTGAGMTAANKAWLAAMHVAMAAALIPLLSRTARARAPQHMSELTRQAA